MRNTFVVILLLITLSASGATYYVDPSGSDANSGSSGSPWKTLAYACSRVKTAGDVIHLNSGTFIETAQSLLAVGVSIEGEGVSTVIQSRVGASKFTILLSSSAQATNGNQHISDLKMDGNNLTAYGAIRVDYRKNVEIHDCTFINFSYFGVWFENGEPPTTWATGNKFYDNKIDNCAGFYGGNRDALHLNGQDGMLIYNNNITQNRSNGLNGNCIGAVEGFNKNVKIYSNTLNKKFVPGTTNWDFAIEMWNGLGGIEIYDNVINGSIDITRSSKGSSAFGVWIHDNTIGQEALLSSESIHGILLERNNSGIIIERNYIKNVVSGISIGVESSVPLTVENIDIKCNILYNIGVGDGYTDQKGWGILYPLESIRVSIINNINVWNNVIMAHTGGRTTMWGLQLPDFGHAKNVSIRNNIVQGFSYAPVYARGDAGTTVDYLSLENNIFYNNGNSNAPRYVNGITPTHNTTQNNIISNPLFVSGSDFHVQAGSPAIGKGLATSGATTDFDGNAFFDPPTIGAYEYGSSAPSVNIPVYQSAVVEDATPALLEMTYNISLASTLPSTSAFSVQVNSKAVAVNKVAVSGTKVQLTLASSVIAGDVVTVAYTKPSTNPLQSTSGGQAATLSAKTVTNRVMYDNPVYVSSVIENATPALLEMTYDVTLANVIPDVSAFSVMVNSNARTVTKVAVSGTRVQLTLASPVVYGETVRVSYTKPTANPLQIAAGGQAASISSQTVTNKVSSPAPVYVSSAIANATPAVLEMTYNLSLANIVPATSAFVVRVNSTARTVTKVVVSGTKVQLTLASAVASGNIVTVAYTKPSRNPLQTATGGQAATISAQTVTNNVTSVDPVYVSSAIENATPALLEMTYSLSLANTVPAASAFVVRVNNTTRTISKVAVTGTKVQLTLSSAVINTDVVTVAYTKPSANPLQTASGGQAATISAQAVTNNIKAIDPVYVSSAIANATPALVEMTYNLTLANKVPATSAFIVRVNNTSRTISKVAVTGTKVQLTLSSAVVNTDVVTVAYTKPSTNPLQTASGGQAATISAQAVTNNINSVDPAYVSAAVEDATPALATVTYNLTLANIVPAVSSFTVHVNSATRAVSKVAVSGTKVQLTLGTPVITGDIITVSYTKPASNPLQTTAGGTAANFTNKAVVNNCKNIAPVVSLTAPANNATYTPTSKISITASATDSDGSISMVEFYNGNTKLGSKTAAPYTFDWNNVGAGIYSLTAVAIDNENSKKVSAAITVTVAVPVVTGENQPPVVAISNPSKGNAFNGPTSIDIEVTASDPDGQIIKVELYNGSSKIADLTTVPYLYTWKDVQVGSYSIKAVAYDNKNASAASSIIQFKVGTAPIYDANSEIINLYPNPNDGNFSIEFLKPLEDEKCRIIITDLGGKQVADLPVLQGETVMNFNLSSIKSGMYIMMVIGKNIVVTKKFIKY
jgi:uncharacterized repeat protein (TIGR02059 family)